MKVFLCMFYITNYPRELTLFLLSGFSLDHLDTDETFDPRYRLKAAEYISLMYFGIILFSADVLEILQKQFLRRHVSQQLISLRLMRVEFNYQHFTVSSICRKIYILSYPLVKIIKLILSE